MIIIVKELLLLIINIFILQEFTIEIIPMDDDSPVIQINKGLQFLETLGSSAGNIITANDLKVVDQDTTPDKLKFVVRAAPQFGRLEKTTNPGMDIMAFTQGKQLAVL